MSHYFLGVDIGNSKSHALIANENGQAVGFGRAGNGSWEGLGWDGARRVLHHITDQAIASAGIHRRQIIAAGFGMAGYDWPEDRPGHLAIIESLRLNAPFDIVNDAMIGLLAGATAGWGVGVVAGTSCNCYGRSPQGQIGRMTGFSAWFAENAGSGELVSRAIQAVALAWSRRGPATRLTDAFLAVTGATNVVDLLAGLTRRRYHLSARNCPTVFEVAAAGDEVALELVRWAGRELGSMAVGVIRQLSFEPLDFEVVLSGSFFNGSPLVTEVLRDTIHAVAPGATLVRLDAPPVVGGVVLAMQQFGLDTAAVRPALVASTSRLVEIEYA
jgi:N-acetylglucosamine kinase-like BadF-type ATPase